MKIRADFVTNSSSTSYICPGCDKEFVGRDGSEEYDMFKCKKCHSMVCEKCSIERAQESVFFYEHDTHTCAECVLCGPVENFHVTEKMIMSLVKAVGLYDEFKKKIQERRHQITTDEELLEFIKKITKD